jgi:hypothetical protein
MSASGDERDQFGRHCWRRMICSLDRIDVVVDWANLEHCISELGPKSLLGEPPILRRSATFVAIRRLLIGSVHYVFEYEATSPRCGGRRAPRLLS